MSISPRKLNNQKNNANQVPFNPQYLNFIRKNHVKFEIQSRFNPITTKDTNNMSSSNHLSAMTNPEDVFDDKKQFYQQNINSQKKIQPLSTIDQTLLQNKSNNKIQSTEKSYITKNYQTIDVVTARQHQKYSTLGQSTIIPRMKQKYDLLYNNNNDEDESQESLLKKRIIKQSLLQNQQFIEILQKKNKQIAQKLRSQQTIHYDYKRKQHNQISHFIKQSNIIEQNKAQSQLRNYKSQHSHQSNLIHKKQNIRDLWKQKFINHNINQNSSQLHNNNPRYEKKKPQSQLKLPNINFHNNNKEYYQREQTLTGLQNYNAEENQLYSNIFQLELDDCNLIKNSKPKPSKQKFQPMKQCLINNQSIQMLSHQSLQLNQKQTQNVKSYKNKKIQEWEQNLLKRQNSIESYHKKVKNHNNPQNQSSLLHAKNSSLSIIKRRRNVPQKITHFLASTDPLSMSKQMPTSQRKKKTTHKQIAKQKQKQFQKYLTQNSILKSAKIVNYYEKQQHKKKLLFNELQKKNFYQAQQKFSLAYNDKQTNPTNKQPSKTFNTLNVDQINPMSNQDEYQKYEVDPNEIVQQIQNVQMIKSTQINPNSNLIDKSVSPVKKKNININFLKKDSQLSIYQMKIRSYREFIFMINLSHKIFLPINLKPASEIKNQIKYTYFIGKGNNRLLIKSLMNRRFWWEEVKDQFKANFVWTQLKVNQLYKFQKVSPFLTSQNKFDKFQQPNDSTPLKKEKKKHTLKNPQKAGYYKPPLPQASQMKIFTKLDRQIYENIALSALQNPQNYSNFNNRLKLLPVQSLNTALTQQSLHEQKVHNHLEFNFFIGNKKALFYNMCNYYKLIEKNPFQVIPFTLHIKKGVQDPAYNHFLKQYKKIAKEQASNGLKNLWIVKPGQLSNRGQGITVIDQVYELNNILKKKQKHNNGTQKSYILQKYIQRPLLYKNRKFDIRHYVLITRFHGRLRAYFYGQGYIRTSSKQFKLDQLDQMIHLTNDAIQKYGDNYGKHQDGNKVSYTQFQRYLDSTFGQGKHNFAEQIYPKMKNIALDSIKATYSQLDPKCLQHNFELLGLDFMIDSKFNVWLIQVNTNPCLQLSSKLLERLIPQMAQNTLRVCIDPIFPPSTQYPNSLKHMCPDNPLERLQYELIFDEARDGKQLDELYKKCSLRQLYKDMGEVDEEDATFENEGKQIEFKNQKPTQDNE